MIGETILLAMAEIHVGDFAVRSDEDDPKVASLAESIKRVGLLQPLLVRQLDVGFELMVGHRRYAACLHARLESVPCRVHEGTESDAKECVFAENFHRADVSPIEQAAGIKDALDSGVMSEEDVGGSFNRTVEWVKRQVALLGWPPSVLEAIHHKRVTVGAGSWLAMIDDKTYRDFLLGLAVDGGVTVRTAEGWYKGWQMNRPAEEVGQEKADPIGTSVVTPVAECPCLCCGNLNRPDAMANVLMCPGCITAMRGSHRSGS